jgi:predicted ATP-dependent endonuclease of OLD family
MRYQRFNIKNYKAIKSAEINLSSDGLVLLLGINESGKTSVLRAIESFDHTNDPESDPLRTKFYKSIRNKKELNSVASVTAEILIEKNDRDRIKQIFLDHSIESSLDKIDKIATITITRIFVYQNAEFVKQEYKIAGEFLPILKPDLSQETQDAICKNILGKCPSIQYFEDFKDQIPDFINMTPGGQYYDLGWSSTIEGLFFHADSNVTVEQFQNLSDVNARKSALNKVNLALNKQFTNRWNKKLKGVKSIHEVELVYDPSTRLFTFQIVGEDKTTVFAIDERSKGALWYFTFLLKTEFKKRKLRADLGKTLYLIDEPGSNLHSSAQVNMVEDFRTLASDSNVIYTTHSQYLIDKENLSNVYIVECRGIVRVVKYQEYLQGKKIETSYYQPIIDALEIQPFSLDVPWKKVLLVEGIYDYCGFKFMFSDVLKAKINFVILPGTGASGHTTLISLHVGWGAKICVLLDNDVEGRQNLNSYISKFPTLKNNILTLEESTRDIEFEDLFDSQERLKLSKIAGFSGKVTKKIFQQTLANISYSENLTKQATTVISSSTKNRFLKILSNITTVLA